MTPNLLHRSSHDLDQEYFAEVDEDYILDRFNLTGLNGEVVQEYSHALDLITDSLGRFFLSDPR